MFCGIIPAMGKVSSKRNSAKRRKKRDRRRRQRLNKQNVIGLPQIQFVEDALVHLRQAHDHPNRKLFFDDLFVAMLLAFYNPVIRSLRGIEDASQMPGINKHLDIDAIKRSTVSDAMKVFDPELLLPLIKNLREQVTPKGMDKVDPTLGPLLNRLIAFDGSYFSTACDVTHALHQRHGGKLHGRVRLNLHLSVSDGVPTGVSISGSDDPGEPAAMLEGVTAGQIVVADRGCFSHESVEQLKNLKADLVLRLQSSVRCDVIATRTLTQADIDAGVISDQTVLLNGCKNPYKPRPMRLVTISPEGDSTRVTKDGQTPAKSDKEPSPIRLLTSVQDESVAAWMIGYLYRRRWDIELFFRWLKACVKWEHLLSESSNGMLMQFYVALIGTLLLAAATGRKPDTYSFRLMSLAASGQGSFADAKAILDKRWAERDRAKQRRLEKQAQSKL